MKVLNYIALCVGIIAAINWGLVGLFGFNVIAFLFGTRSIIATIIYILIGVCGLYMLTFFSRLEE